MHELSIMLEIVKTVEQSAAENEVSNIETLVLQIGELSSMIPKFIEEVYPAAVTGTILEGTKLEIEMLPAIARCNACGKTFNAVAYKGICPECGGKELKLLSGREFNIKEIVVT
ncbi:MAG: hydrogenase maturation nickel metallochaperone HypA [Clostridiales Family XIII bacterium]|jgi:hydrogenase nickel incorporation protein HypA/HybF|nr:hydrogenase maturation nickel metallochaperone HypA [Clostridiales Family XIII bacterium]